MLTKAIIEEMMAEPEPINFSKEEEAYRRGFSHGFVEGRSDSDITQQEVMSWRYSNDETGAPGSFLQGKYIPGLRKEPSKDE